MRLGQSEGASGPPFAVMRSLPVSGLPQPTTLPFLFIENEEGEVVFHREALVFAVASLAAYELSTIQRDIETVQRLYDFYRVSALSGALLEDHLDYLVYAYLIWRHSGTLTEEGVSRHGGLRWRPVAFEALRAEFSALNRFFRFCSKTWGYVSLGGVQQAVRLEGAPLERMRATASMKERDFFVHLNASREYWAKQFGYQMEMPPVARPVRGREGLLRHIMPEEEVWRVIGQERNPVYRALWLVGAFGGIRISEQLNAWQCDVLPSSARQLLFQYDGGSNILFLRADPVSSRYLGDLGKGRVTREQHLRLHYGIRPRCALGSNDPLYAGWKGTLYLQRELMLNEVFWLSQQAALLFSQCAEEIREFHRIHRTSERHPFLYVNMADRTGEHLTNPLKISNVEAAWQRACHRCHLEPHRWGRNIHGLRHFYKALANSMCFSPGDIQIMMGHRRVESQNSYGRTARDIALRLGKSGQQTSRISFQA